MGPAAGEVLVGGAPNRVLHLTHGDSISLRLRRSGDRREQVNVAFGDGVPTRLSPSPCARSALPITGYLRTTRLVAMC